MVPVLGFATVGDFSHPVLVLVQMTPNQIDWFRYSALKREVIQDEICSNISKRFGGPEKVILELTNPVNLNSQEATANFLKFIGPERQMLLQISILGVKFEWETNLLP